jgi:hypothetical protein
MVIGGLMSAISWSRTRGEAKQRELIGMTAEAEVSRDDLYGVLSRVSDTIGASTDKAAQPAPPAIATFETEHTTIVMNAVRLVHRTKFSYA